MFESADVLYSALLYCHGAGPVQSVAVMIMQYGTIYGTIPLAQARLPDAGRMPASRGHHIDWTAAGHWQLGDAGAAGVPLPRKREDPAQRASVLRLRCCSASCLRAGLVCHHHLPAAQSLVVLQRVPCRCRCSQQLVLP